MEKSAVADPLVGRLVDSRYRVEAIVARGGMATVYEATDLRLDRRVALKVLPHALADDDEFAQRFVREARAAARLTHPNVVAVYDQGDDHGVLFLTMEYVEGRHTLRDVIRSEAPLSPIRALALLEEILRALSAAHESGIIHRDIKPENVLITPRGQVKVADFGLARAISASTSATATGGVLMGTVSYLPPELVVDGSADARSDVYSVGVLLFELLTGRKPHVGDSPIQVAYKHVHEDVPPPSSLVPGIPPYLDAFVARATARSRDLRPADAHVMLQQLRRVRHALEHGVVDDHDLTEDLTPTVAVPTSAGRPLGSRSPDDVFDQEAFGPDARTMIVGAAAVRPETTLEEPGGPRLEPARYAPPAPPSRRTRTARRRGRRAGWIAFVVVLLLAASAAIAGWYYGAGRYQNTPNIIGMTQSSAATKLQSDGLTLQVTGAAYSETIPDGHLISSDPGPGHKVSKGGTVHAVISKGPERHAVPNLDGMTEAQAADAVTARSLTLAPVTRAWSDSVPEGSVVSFTPEAGQQLKRDGLVHVVISKGPEPIRIPSYIHEDASHATVELKALGFVVTPVSVYNDTVPAGTVIDQTPHDATGFKGDHVRLLVSKGPHLVKVPDVYHNGTAAAEAALTADGFHYEVKQYTPNFGLGFVVVQSPGAGEMAPYGSTVVIYIV